MKSLHFLLAACFLLLGCKESKPAATAKWYDPWIAEQLALGAEFHSEFELRSGAQHTIAFDADAPSEVGYVVKDGYDVAKSSGTIYFGPDDHPRISGGSPGVRYSFTPIDGKILVRFENTSPIDTKLAAYIKKANKPPLQIAPQRQF